MKAALWGVTEFPNTLEKHEMNIPKKLYLIVDDNHNVINLSVYTATIALLLKHDMNQIIGCNTQLFIMKISEINYSKQFEIVKNDILKKLISQE